MTMMMYVQDFGVGAGVS